MPNMQYLTNVSWKLQFCHLSSHALSSPLLSIFSFQQDELPQGTEWRAARRSWAIIWEILEHSGRPSVPVFQWGFSGAARCSSPLSLSDLIFKCLFLGHCTPATLAASAPSRPGHSCISTSTLAASRDGTLIPMAAWPPLLLHAPASTSPRSFLI